ncbi:MAG: 5'-nucleotidase C-terminal domain-containing protein [Faecalibacterium sp.]
MPNKKITRRTFLQAAGVSAAAAAVAGGAPAASACLWPLQMDLQILATSDTHGRFLPWDYAANKADTSGSVAQQAAAIAQRRTPSTIVVDAGDTIQGNSAELFLQDEMHPMSAGMNAIGYDVWVTGNHEFNFGMDTLKRVIAQQKAKVLVGNVYAPDGTPLADGYTILNKQGVKVGVIGMVTPNITRWDSKNLEGWTVTNPVDECRKLTKQLRGQVDVLLGVMHMDPESEYGVYGSGARDLAEACPEFDVIVAAHGHRSVPGEMINGVLVVENSGNASTLSEIHLQLKRKWDGGWSIDQRTSEIVSMKDLPADAALSQQLAGYDARAKADAETLIGELRGGNMAPENDVVNIPQPMVQDTALLDFINEVQMYYTGAKVAATSLTSMTSQMKEGPIRKCDTASIYTYQNTLYKLEMNGAQLRSFMEWSAGFFKTWVPGDLTVAFDPSTRYYLYDAFEGVNYEIDVSQEPGGRIRNLTWPDGSPVRDEEVFTVAVNNYRATTQLLIAADIFAPGEPLPKLLEIDVRGDLGGIRELLGEYIRTVKGGVIQPKVNNNWKLVGTNWDEAKRAQALKLLAEGKMPLPGSSTSRTLPGAAVTEADLAAVK